MCVVYPAYNTDNAAAQAAKKQKKELMVLQWTIDVYKRQVPWSIGRLLVVLTVPFLTANNELLLLLRWVRPE